jgi:hypothetical protein
MRRFLILGVLALAGIALAVSDVNAWGAMPPGVGGGGRRIGRVHGFWLNPSTGRLKDYSSYFAAKYPWLPGAAEYQFNPYAYPPPGAPMPAHPGAMHAAPRVISVTPAKPIETVEPPKK